MAAFWTFVSGSQKDVSRKRRPLVAETRFESYIPNAKPRLAIARSRETSGPTCYSCASDLLACSRLRLQPLRGDRGKRRPLRGFADRAAQEPPQARALVGCRQQA